MTLVVKVLRKIIHNEAMKTDPDEIYGWRVFALVFSACFGGMLFGWETGTIGGVLAMDGTKQRFGYAGWSKDATSLMEQNIVSTLQAGCILGCLITGWLADTLGRRWSLIGAGGLTAVGVFLQAASAIRGTIGVMYFGRFTAGVGVGAASTLTPLYISECAPRAIRGALTAFYQLFNVFGIMISFWVNYGCLLHVPAPAVYIVPLALQAVPAILLILGMLACPESPRWCARKDDWEEAKNILVRLRGLPEESEFIREELQEMSSQLEAERQLVGDASTKTLFKEMVMIPGNRKRTFISIMLMICQQMTGVNAINYYAPQIFKNLGMVGTDTSLFATGVYGIVKFVACAIFIAFVADSLGRRRSLLWTSAAQGIVMYTIGVYGRVEPPVAGSPVTPFGYVAIAFIYLWAALFQFGWGPVCWILISEIPTARLRALSVSLGAATQWLFNFVVARSKYPVFPNLETKLTAASAVLTMQSTMGEAGFGMFFMFGTFDFLMGTFVWFMVPETKGVALEKMDELFGMAELVTTPKKGLGSVTSIREEYASKP
ncbi:hypothetical protein ACHAPT_005483 [Fusarium lateritium]